MSQELKQQLARQMMEQAMRERAQEGDGASYQDFNAAKLFCPKCKEAMPVKEKMLLVLSGGELFDYVCEQCGTSLGTRQT